MSESVNERASAELAKNARPSPGDWAQVRKALDEVRGEVQCLEDGFDRALDFAKDQVSDLSDKLDRLEDLLDEWMPDGAGATDDDDDDDDA
jgi:hypothetical protein